MANKQTAFYPDTSRAQLVFALAIDGATPELGSIRMWKTWKDDRN